MAHELPDLMTTAQVAKHLGYHVATIRRWADSGYIPTAHTSPGGHRRFRRTDVNALFTGHKPQEKSA